MLHIDGFEQYANEQSVTNALKRAEYTATGTWANVSGRGRDSRAISGNKATVSRVFPWTGAKFSMGFAGYFSARGSMAWLKIGAGDLTLWLDPDTGLPRMGDTVGGALPTKNRYYYYEIEVDRDTGSMALYINGRYDSQYLGAPLPSADSVEVFLGWRPPSEYRPGETIDDNSVKTFDDFYIRDGARIDPIMITTRFPDFDVSVQWFKASEEATHAATLSLRPPEPLDNHLVSDTIGHTDTFTSAQTLQNANPIVATALVVLARKSPTINAKLGVFMGDNSSTGADLREADKTVTTDWIAQFACFERDDQDTIAGIVAAPFGITVSPP